MIRNRPVPLRFAVCLRLGSGEIAAIEFDWLDQAVSFARRISFGEWWEVLDKRTHTVVASSDRPR